MNTRPNVIAIITARGGSKRVPKKNIRDFHGKPIIHYPIEAALASGIFSEVMVSTEDQEIAQIALAAGAKVPFLRTHENATDTALPVDVFTEVLSNYKKIGREFSHFSCIFPTAAFVTANWLQQAFQEQQINNADSVIAVSRFSSPVQRALKLEGEYLKMFAPQYLATRSQDLSPAFHDCGQFFICRTDSFLQTKKILTDRSIAFEIPENEAQDIDSEEDWKMAELKFELRK